MISKVGEAVKGLMPETATKFEERVRIPDDVDQRVKRATTRTKQDVNKRNECWSFWRGNQFAYLNDKGGLSFMSTGGTGIRAAGKPSWKSRLTVNLFRDHCEQQVSLACQRVPSYDVVPSTTDSEDYSAAKLSRKVAYYGHDKWGFTKVTENTVRHAVVGDEGFAWPYWDSSVGPYVDDGQGETIGLGEIGIRVFGANQVGWEPGQCFDQSPYHYVEYATTAASIKERGDYMGGELVDDAATEATATGYGKAAEIRMVLVKEYLEKPSMKFPNGRWLTIANKRLVAGKGSDDNGKDAFRPYPCAEYGYDGIVLHRLTHYDDSDSDRGQGMGRDLLDPMRIVRDCMNALVEWKDILLKPRMFITPGVSVTFTGEPGQQIRVPQPRENVQVMDTPNAPTTLFDLMAKAEDQMARIAAQSDPPVGAESAKSFQVWDERQKVRGYTFYAQLAKWYSGLMTHCLYLVQKHYTEDRLLKIRGSSGWESIDAFLGSDLRGQVDVRVMPDSLEPQTREATEQKIFFYAQQQWISPERAMEAIEQGTADKLIEDINNDRERMNRIIQAIKQGPQAIYAMKGRQVGFEPDLLPDGTPNPAAGKPMYEPGFMPRPFDNLPVQKYTLETWMKSQEYDLEITDDMRDVAWQVYQGILMLEAQQQAQQAMAQQQMAEGLGMANAAAPQGPSPLPDQPAVPGGNPGQTANQPDNQAIPQGA